MSAFIEIIDNLTNRLRKWFQRFKGGERVRLLSGTTNALIEKIFPTEHRDEVANILIYECGNNLRDHKRSNEHDLERIRFAVLKMSLGDVQRLRRAVKLAQEDRREAFMGAGFEVSITAHEEWARSILQARSLAEHEEWARSIRQASSLRKKL
jgi:hypothetical protein